MSSEQDTHKRQELRSFSMVLEIEHGHCAPLGLVLGVMDLVGLGDLVVLEGRRVLALEVGAHRLVPKNLASFLPPAKVLAANVADRPMRSPLLQGEVFPQLTHIATGLRLTENKLGTLR